MSDINVQFSFVYGTGCDQPNSSFFLYSGAPGKLFNEAVYSILKNHKKITVPYKSVKFSPPPPLLVIKKLVIRPGIWHATNPVLCVPIIP